MEANSFDDGVPGEGQPSPNYKAYADARSMITGLETADLKWVRSHGTPAAQLYAAVLLWESSRVSAEDAYGPLIGNKSAVRYLSGCKGTESTVDEVARTFLKQGFYYNFKPSIFCKLTTPSDKHHK